MSSLSSEEESIWAVLVRQSAIRALEVLVTCSWVWISKNTLIRAIQWNFLAGIQWQWKRGVDQPTQSTYKSLVSWMSQNKGEGWCLNVTWRLGENDHNRKVEKCKKKQHEWWLHDESGSPEGDTWSIFKKLRFFWENIWVEVGNICHWKGEGEGTVFGKAEKKDVRRLSQVSKKAITAASFNWCKKLFRFDTRLHWKATVVVALLGSFAAVVRCCVHCKC